MRIAWTTLAQHDLKTIYTYIAEDSPKNARKIVHRLHFAVITQLHGSPLSGRIGRIDGTRELIVPHLPYIIPYRTTEHGVEVLRVLHTSREWPSNV